VRRRKPLVSKTPLRPKPRGADRGDRAMRMVRARDNGCLLRPRGDCFGPLTIHHLRKQSQGGKWTIENCVMLCAGHNDAVEDNPDEFHGLGLVVRHGETVEMAWAKLHDYGLVDYLWDGEEWTGL
jgi:hypothetical protein